jgi:hypothetical protein
MRGISHSPVSHSLLTIKLSSAKRFVLRKKPAGQLMSSTAHQIEREYRILSALHQYNISPTTKPEQTVPVPQPVALCEDNSIIGTPFYIMEYLEGRIFTDTRLLELPSQNRREWCFYLISLLHPDAKPVYLKLSLSCPFVGSIGFSRPISNRSWELWPYDRLFSSSNQISDAYISCSIPGCRHRDRRSGRKYSML